MFILIYVTLKASSVRVWQFAGTTLMGVTYL